MSRASWGPTLVIAGLGSVLGVLAGFGSVRNFRSLRLSDDVWTFLAGTVDGRHLTALLVVPLVCVVAYQIGAHYSHDLVWLRLGSRRSATVSAARAGAARGFVVWTAIMAGFLTQTVGMRGQGTQDEVAVVLGSLAAQPIALGVLSAGVATLRLWSRSVALLVAWFLPALFLASLLFPDEWSTVMLPYAYLTHAFWTDGLYAVLAVATVVIAMTLGGQSLARKALPASLALAAALGWGLLQFLTAQGPQQRAPAQVLRQAYDVVTVEGISSSIFGFTLACLAPALVVLGRSEGRFPDMWPLQAVRGAGVLTLLGRDVLRLWSLSLFCWAAALIAQVALASSGTSLKLWDDTLPAATKTLVLISVQCTVYGVVGWLARARARGPAPAVLAMTALAATAPLVVWLPWWPAGQGASVTTEAGWIDVAGRSLWLVTLIVVGTWAATRATNRRRQ